MSGRPKRLQFEWNLLVLVTAALVLFGLVMVYSATSGSAALGNANPFGYVERQVAYAIIGVALLVVISRVDLDRIRLFAPTLVVTALVLCLAVLAVGSRINGARRWIDFGPLAFQPSELAKLALVVWTSAYLSRHRPPRTLKELGQPIGILVLAFAGLVLVEPDLGTALTILLVVGAILLVSGTRLTLLASAYSLVFGLAAVAAWTSPYRRDRLLTFLDPWKDPTGAGLQNVQALISLGSGGVFGRGLGQGIEPLYYLPEAHTDMIFAVVGEELGLIGSTLLIGGFAVFAWVGFQVALECRDPFGKRLAAGITALVCGQAAINLAAVLGLAPLTGIPLPFVSYGGSSLLVMLCGVGVLLNIAVNERVVQARVRDRGRGNGGSRSSGSRSRRSAARTRSDGDVRRHARPRRVAAGA